MDEAATTHSAWPAETYRFSVTSGGLTPEVEALQSAVYAERYGRVPVDGRDGEAVFLVARDRAGKVVGSLRVITVDHRPFSFGDAVELSSFDGIGDRPAEIGRWCVHEDYRSVVKAQGLHFGMMKLAYLYAKARRVSDYLICAYPELERFYRGLFFEDTGVSFNHPDWGQVRMYALNLLRFETRLRGAENNSLFCYLRADVGSNFSLDEVG